MKIVLIDTNIILDFFTARYPFEKDAAEIFKLAYTKSIISYASTMSYANSFYYLKKIIGRKSSLEVLTNMKKFVKTINFDETILDQALHSEFTDFEDALQYYSAKSISEIEIIITRNTKDFTKSKIPVYTPKQFLNQYFLE